MYLIADRHDCMCQRAWASLRLCVAWLLVGFPQCWGVCKSILIFHPPLIPGRLTSGHLHLPRTLIQYISSRTWRCHVECHMLSAAVSFWLVNKHAFVLVGVQVSASHIPSETACAESCACPCAGGQGCGCGGDRPPVATSKAEGCAPLAQSTCACRQAGRPCHRYQGVSPLACLRPCRCTLKYV